MVWKALPRVPSRVSAFGGASTPRSSRGSSVPFEGREVFGAPWFGRQGTYTSEAFWPVRAEKCYQAYNISWGFEFECILGCSMEAGGMWKNPRFTWVNLPTFIGDSEVVGAIVAMGFEAATLP